MNNLKLALSLVLYLAFVGMWVQPSEAETWFETIKKNVTREVSRSGLDNEQLGLLITHSDGDAETIIFEQNSMKAFIPASTTKIITAAATVDKFGPGKKFETHLKSSARLVGKQLQGDLCLSGGGDPGFVSETMWFLVNEFVRTGVKEIEGSIVVDDSRFDMVRTDPSRDPGRVDRAYDAPIGAMSFNWNSVNVFVRPGDKAGVPAVVYLDPDNPYTRLENRATTGRAGTGESLQITRRVDESEPGHAPKDVIIVTGSIALDKEEQVEYKNITAPDWWSGHNLMSFLSQRGIKVKNGVRVGGCPRESVVLAKAEAKPVGQLIQDMMKFSNNYVAEMLTKNLAAEFVSQPGTMDAGMSLIRDFMWRNGLPRDQVVMVNPSGLSRRNHIAPKYMLQLLKRVAKHFPDFVENLSSYPIAGVDGTLKNRMKGTPAEGWIRAKTGMLNGVAALAGFAGRKDGQILQFVFFFNGKDAQTQNAIQLFDRLCVQMVK